MAGKHPGEMSKNHRSRLRKRYSAGGADSFDDYLLMELILFDFIPRVDTYPIAHSLIDTFGSLEKVFTAPKNELMKINGIGPKTAESLHFWGEVMERTVSERLAKSPLLKENAVSQYLLWSLRNHEADTICLLLLDSKGMLLERNVFLPGDNKDASPLDITEEILKSRKPKYAVLAHKHPNQVSTPSPEDISVTEKLEALCIKTNIKAIKHYIVTDTEAIPIENFRSNDKE